MFIVWTNVARIFPRVMAGLAQPSTKEEGLPCNLGWNVSVKA
jgi:hypothetical protein